MRGVTRKEVTRKEENVIEKEVTLLVQHYTYIYSYMVKDE